MVGHLLQSRAAAVRGHRAAARPRPHRHGLDDVRRPPLPVAVVLGDARAEPRLHQGAARQVPRLANTCGVVDPPRRRPTPTRRPQDRRRRRRGNRRTGILLLDPSHRVERASPAARRIVARWYGRFGSELPQELADWLGASFPREPLRVERGGERLVAEAPTRSALVLREEHLASISLTTREREVLSRVADGMSTNEIAHALWITPATVSKHLEHIYRKLGVTGRTAALAALRRTRTT